MAEAIANVALEAASVPSFDGNEVERARMLLDPTQSQDCLSRGVSLRLH